MLAVIAAVAFVVVLVVVVVVVSVVLTLLVLRNESVMEHSCLPFICCAIDLGCVEVIGLSCGKPLRDGHRSCASGSSHVEEWEVLP